MWWRHNGPDGWGALWMGLTMVLVWLPLLAALVWAVRGFTAVDRRDAPPRPADSDARDIARNAYARGDIDRERYLEIVDDLNRTARSEPRSSAG